MINESTIELKSSWGITVQNRFLTHSEGKNVLVVIFPGKYYRSKEPLLYYAERAALSSGCDVLSLTYGYQAVSKGFEKDEITYVIQESLEAVRRVLTKEYTEIFFISKSLGTIVAGEVAKAIGVQRVKHIFLTPLAKTIPHILLAPKCLVVVGDKDDLFTDEHLTQIKEKENIELKVIANANHRLETGDDYRASLHNLLDVTEFCVDFIIREVL